MKNRKGFTLVELMVVVAIIAILAAVGLPMYSTFRQKSRVSTALKAIQGIQSTLITWHDGHGSFTGLTVANGAQGGVITHTGGERGGTALPELPDADWTFTVVDGDNITIEWAFANDSGCPSARCDGMWCLTCIQDDDNCYVAIGAFTDSTLGFNKTQTGASAACTQ